MILDARCRLIGERPNKKALKYGSLFVMISQLAAYQIIIRYLKYILLLKLRAEVENKAITLCCPLKRA